MRREAMGINLAKQELIMGTMFNYAIELVKDSLTH